MANLFGTSYTRAELLQHAGDLSQFAGVRVGELSDGFERGVRTADFRTGSGFEFTVLADRGLDIAWASFNGASLAWRSATTAAAPGFFEPEGLGWLRGFHGGLLTTCGLTYFGSPCRDEGQELGLHGRASYIPATHFAYGGEWDGDEYEMWVAGQVREAAVFGANLVLRRRISARLGESRLFIEDSVTNEGYERTPHMLLYHFNFGFPLLCQDTELLVNSAEVTPRTPEAAAGLAEHRRFQHPTAGYQEQVFFHTLRADAQGHAQATLVNRAFGGGRGLGAYVRFDLAELPRLIEWKMMGQGTYVCAVEPTTNWVDGRAVERAAGRLQFLEPGETRHYRVEVGVLASQAEIDGATDENG
jgi:galactose mutarotase-like enzyme